MVLELLALVIPICVAIWAFFKYPGRLVWWEILLTFSICTCFILLTHCLIVLMMEKDLQYQTEIVTSASYTEAHSTTILVPMSTGKTTTLRPSTVYHSASWVISGSKGSTANISETQYHSIKSLWNNPNKSGYTETVSRTGNPEVDFYFLAGNTYLNTLRMNRKAYSCPDVSEDQIKKYGLLNYPDCPQLQPSCILGHSNLDLTKAKTMLNRTNVRLGNINKVQIWILLFKDQPMKIVELQEALWEGGNHNEFVLCIGLDKNDKVAWTKPFSWTSNEALKEIFFNVYDELEREPLNLEERISKLDQAIVGSWQPPRFIETPVLSVELPYWCILLIGILTGVIGFLFFLWAIDNEHVNEGKVN